MSRRGPFTALVVDDEPAARDAVAGFLAEEPAVEVVGEAAGGEEAVRRTRELRPDLLFLDVQMPGLDGFAVVEALGEEVPPGVVFVTAHDEHAVRAFEVHALDYVLKPFGAPRFRAAVARALRGLQAEEALSARRTLEAMLQGRRADAAEAGTLDAADRSGRGPARLGVRVGNRTVIVDLRSVDWVEADGDYARLHAGGRVHVVSERMHALESLLPGERFVRIHRSVIVNLDRVRELRRDPEGGGAVVLEDDVRLRVARGRWETLERALGLGS